MGPSRIVVSNQRGGVGKTTTSATLARCFADRGMRVLLIDADSQGSIAIVTGLKPAAYLYDFAIAKLAWKECVTQGYVGVQGKIDVVCGSRRTTEAEGIMIQQPFREFAFEQLLKEHEDSYDVVIIDVSPSISLFQTCAMVYARQVLVPVDMDILSVHGAMASIQAAEMLNRLLGRNLDVRVIGMLPVKVDRRLAITSTVLDTLSDISRNCGVPLLPQIRTDQSIVKAARSRQFVADFEPQSKALGDYRTVAESLLVGIQGHEVAYAHAEA